jgi:hypothetical protein
VIGAKRVTAPDGTEWRVGRRWLPEWPRFWRRDAGDGGDGLLELGGAFDDAFGLGGIAGRLVFRKPWTIRARRAGDRSELRWHASGFRRSGRVRDEVAAALAHGQTDIRPREATTAVT